MRRLRSRAQGGGYAAAVLARGVGGRSLRDRPSGVKGRCAIATRRPTAALDPGASAAPVAASQRRAVARRQPATAHTDAEVTSTKIRQFQVSTVSGDCHLVPGD